MIITEHLFFRNRIAFGRCTLFNKVKISFYNNQRSALASFHVECHSKKLLFCFLVQAAVAAQSMIVHEIKETTTVRQVGFILAFVYFLVCFCLGDFAFNNL